jgi:hypothetical protein
MSTTPAATDHHQPACDALERSIPMLAEAIRRAPGDVRPAKMRWTNAEIAAHLYVSAVEAHKLARGVPSLYDGTGPTAELDEKMVASVDDRDTTVLADLVEHASARFLGTVRALDGADPSPSLAARSRCSSAWPRPTTTCTAASSPRRPPPAGRVSSPTSTHP